LPSSEPSRPGEVALELLIASGMTHEELAAALSDAGGRLDAVERRKGAAAPAAAVAPSPVVRSSLPPHRTTRPAPSPAPPEGRPQRGTQLSLRSLTSVVRVEIRKLDHLMNAVGELGTVRNAVAKLLDKMRVGVPYAELVLEAQRVHRSFDRHLGVVQDAVLEVRMVPLSQLFDKLAVVVRQLAREQNKRVQLLVRGAETEVDKLIAEDIADPLVHLVRNAVDHGIESEGERADKGKPSLGSVRVHAYQKGNQVVIEVGDDGRGVTPATVRKVAVERGLLERAQADDLSDREALGLIFLPGFSTSTQVSDISGRGVGMDAVRTTIRELGGEVLIEATEHTPDGLIAAIVAASA
jgi:two-component system, chemotaxis family, sensor kinase CheA